MRPRAMTRINVETDALGHSWEPGTGICRKCKRSLRFVSTTEKCNPATTLKDHDPVFDKESRDPGMGAPPHGAVRFYKCSRCARRMARVEDVWMVADDDNRLQFMESPECVTPQKARERARAAETEQKRVRNERVRQRRAEGKWKTTPGKTR